ncbi:hypothetical protein CY35_U002800, partial [Sphagnum magellanicum]
MPGLRRDVLCWLVALNLSFPIKNIKRDFSNGFLVAEIFSRYFPHDIHMHSYDCGTRLEKKRDNWAQLQKFFQKRSFVVMKDEIDSIINCGPHDGSSPFLERMYKCLTQNGKVVQQWIGHMTTFNHGTLQENNDSELIQSSYAKNFANKTSTFTSNTYSNLHPHGVELPLFCSSYNHNEDTAPKQNSHFIGNTEHTLLPKNDSENKKMKRTSLTAVEKARQKEIKEKKMAKQALETKISPQSNPATSNAISSNAGLAFRSTNRQRNFKQYTLTDYRTQKMALCLPLGKLGVHKEFAQLNDKQEKLEQVKEFGRLVRSCNNYQVGAPKKSKIIPLSKHKKALEFAAKIPKPKQKEVFNKNHLDEKKRQNHEQNIRTISKIQLLEAKHHIDQKRVQ